MSKGEVLTAEVVMIIYFITIALLRVFASNWFYMIFGLTIGTLMILIKFLLNILNVNLLVKSTPSKRNSVFTIITHSLSNIVFIIMLVFLIKYTNIINVYSIFALFLGVTLLPLSIIILNILDSFHIIRNKF